MNSWLEYAERKNAYKRLSSSDGKGRMGSVLGITNKFDSKQYRVSIIPTHKLISIPSGFGFGRMDEWLIIFQAAIYRANKIPYKPLFVINFGRGIGGIKKEELENLVSRIISNEKIGELINESTNVYSKYGFLSRRYDMWSLFTFSKIKHIFLVENV